MPRVCVCVCTCVCVCVCVCACGRVCDVLSVSGEVGEMCLHRNVFSRIDNLSFKDENLKIFSTFCPEVPRNLNKGRKMCNIHAATIKFVKT